MQQPRLDTFEWTRLGWRVPRILISLTFIENVYSGTPTEQRDMPIFANYSNDTIDSSTTLLTWSGSGAGTAHTANCARVPEIPIANPATFFTRFLIRN